MVDTITLSLPALDVLGEHLRLDVRRYPFEIPDIADSRAEREDVVRRVWSELETAGLAVDGRPEPEVADALYLMSSSETSIAAAGLLDVRNGQRMAARAVATGEVGVAGVITARGLQLDFMAPETLPEVCARLLPPARPGPGRETSVSLRLLRDAEHRSAEGVSGAADSPSEVEEITRLHKYRLGHFVVAGTGGDGNRFRMPTLTWFDTDRGRYTMCYGRSEEDETLVCAPADQRGIAARLGEQLRSVRGS
ncbi:EspG family protein [Actinopolyspora lacussalsi subsp. righensis]|uniref:EspG family protein n=1 Tax=Actinopolyspora righensis TaxID=995060 RepID=A0A1I6Y1E2_9ACTN|nr:ESX secretion-associated protein EspG [Actinopolyspora righensis]SFT44197.1 EspG family protein [Actinopolyspora righensis]